VRDGIIQCGCLMTHARLSIVLIDEAATCCVSLGLSCLFEVQCCYDLDTATLASRQFCHLY
jgi:hypothetical protein